MGEDLAATADAFGEGTYNYLLVMLLGMVIICISAGRDCG